MAKQNKLREITEFLRSKVTIADLLSRLMLTGNKKPSIPPGTTTNFFTVCVNPKHYDGDQDGGSLHIGDDPRRASCFGENLYGMSIFDLYALHLGYDESKQMTQQFSRSVREVAYLFADELNRYFGEGNWEAEFEKQQAPSLVRQLDRSLSELADFNPTFMPKRGPHIKVPLKAWKIPAGDKEPYKLILQTAQENMRTLLKYEDELIVISYDNLNLLGFHANDWSLVSIGKPRQQNKIEGEPYTFTIYTLATQFVNGKTLNQKDSPTRSYNSTLFYYVVENPLDYHVLWLMNKPVILGRWVTDHNMERARAGINRLQEMTNASFLCLMSLQMKGTDTRKRFERFVSYPPIPSWIPKQYAFDTITTFGNLDPKTVERYLSIANRKATAPDYPS